MRLNIFLQKSSNLFAENRLLKFCILVIGVMVLINTVILQAVTQKEKVILIPPTIGSDLFVTGKDASDGYIRGLTRYVMSLYLNYSAVSVKGQIEDLLSMYEPKSFAKVEGTFNQFINDVIRSRISSSYYIMKISINREKGIINVEGIRKQHMHEKEIYSEKENYRINYRIRDSKFLIKKIERKEA